MSGRSIQHGTADVSTVIRIIDSTAGTPENAVEHDTAGIDLWYRREEATKTSITEAALATLDAAHSDGGIELIGDGYYRLDLPDLACAAGVAGVAVGGTITGMIVIGTYHPLVAYNPQDAVRLGLTALPNAAADAAGGLAISDAGGLDLDALNTAAIRLTAARAQVLDDWINAGRLDAILDIIAADVVNIDGDAMRGTDSAATAAKLLSYVQLMCRSDDAIETDNATELTEINTDEGSGAGDFSNETDGLEGLRDRGDQAWLTGAGGSATASHTTTTWARTIGDNDGGAGSDTATVNATYFSTGETGAGNYLEVDATFDITDGEMARSINIWGKYDGGGAHYIRVQARNYTDSTWEDIGVMGASSSDLSYAFTLTPDHTDTTGDQVQIKFLHAGGNGNGSHTFDIDKAQVNTATPAVNLTAAEVVDEWETQSQADPTGFHVNVKEVSDTAQTANDNGADINTLVTRVTAAVATAAELAKVPKSDGTSSWNATALAAINGEADTALSDYDPPTNTEMAAAFTEIKGATWASGTDTLEHIRNKQTDIETDTAQIGVAGAGLTEAGGDGDHLTESGGTGDQLTALATAAEVAKVPKSDDSVTWNATALASINTEADTALSDYDPPTNAEMEARTPTAAQLLYIVENAATGMPVTFTTSGGSTTAAVINEIDGAAGSATDDQYNSRLLVFTDGTLKGVVTDITDYDGGTTTATITAIPVAPTSSHNARLI